MRQQKRIVKTIDDYFDEMDLLPTSEDDIDFNVTDPLEQYFFDVADKHGIFGGPEDDRGEW